MWEQYRLGRSLRPIPCCIEAARQYIEHSPIPGSFREPIATVVESSDRFLPAEASTTDFVKRNPLRVPMLVVHDLPNCDVPKHVPGVRQVELKNTAQIKGTSINTVLDLASQLNPLPVT